MGRPRSFDTAAVLVRARDAFVAKGYNGTSIDDLLSTTGLQRASLYQAFGSKRGLFVTLLRGAPVDLDLLLVALMDLSATDDEIRGLAQAQVAALGVDAPVQVGRRLLERGIATPIEQKEGEQS